MKGSKTSVHALSCPEASEPAKRNAQSSQSGQEWRGRGGEHRREKAAPARDTGPGAREVPGETVRGLPTRRGPAPPKQASQGPGPGPPARRGTGHAASLAAFTVSSRKYVNRGALERALETPACRCPPRNDRRCGAFGDRHTNASRRCRARLRGTACPREPRGHVCLTHGHARPAARTDRGLPGDAAAPLSPGLREAHAEPGRAVGLGLGVGEARRGRAYRCCRRTGTRPRRPAGSPGSRPCPRRCRPPAGT